MTGPRLQACFLNKMLSQCSAARLKWSHWTRDGTEPLQTLCPRTSGCTFCSCLRLDICLCSLQFMPCQKQRTPYWSCALRHGLQHWQSWFLFNTDFFPPCCNVRLCIEWNFSSLKEKKFWTSLAERRIRSRHVAALLWTQYNDALQLQKAHRQRSSHWLV